MTGQPEAALLRLTGVVHHSLPDSEDLGQELAHGMDRSASVNVPCLHLATGGILQHTPNSTMLSWVRNNYMIYDYCKHTKWFNGQMPEESVLPQF